MTDYYYYEFHRRVTLGRVGPSQAIDIVNEGQINGTFGGQDGGTQDHSILSSSNSTTDEMIPKSLSAWAFTSSIKSSLTDNVVLIDVSKTNFQSHIMICLKNVKKKYNR